MHLGNHLNSYYEYVDDALAKAKTKDEALDILAAIKQMLLDRTLPLQKVDQ